MEVTKVGRLFHKMRQEAKLLRNVLLTGTDWNDRGGKHGSYDVLAIC